MQTRTGTARLLSARFTGIDCRVEWMSDYSDDEYLVLITSNLDQLTPGGRFRRVWKPWVTWDHVPAGDAPRRPIRMGTIYTIAPDEWRSELRVEYIVDSGDGDLYVRAHSYGPVPGGVVYRPGHVGKVDPRWVVWDETTVASTDDSL